MLIKTTAMALVLAVSGVPPCAAQTVRVGVFVLFKPAELRLAASGNNAIALSAGNQNYVLEAGSSTTSAQLTISANRLVLSIAGESRVVESIRASARDGGPVQFVLAVPGKIRRQFRGTLTVTSADGRLVPAVEMDLEVAVAAVVQSESPPGAPLEALRAQAVVTRSYYLAGRGRHREFDFCDTTHCQLLREAPPPSAPAAIAAAQTRGLVLAYKNKPFPAMFTASCSGRTRTLSEAGLAARDYPYFPVVCRYCRLHPETWRSRIPQSDASRLAGRTESDRLNVARRRGWNAVPSNSYEMKPDRGDVVLEGAGKGHGIGLCQRGAVDMARRGADFQTILSYYYPNTQIVSSDAATTVSRSSSSSKLRKTRFEALVERGFWTAIISSSQRRARAGVGNLRVRLGAAGLL